MTVAETSLEALQQMDIPHCKFCGEADQDSLERHHIVPRRFHGSDKEENLVTLCASCHRKLESIHDRRFFKSVRNAEKFQCPMCGKGHENHERHRQHVMQCFEGCNT